MFCHYCLPHLGGVETVVEQLCSRLAARHQVTLVSSAWGGRSGEERRGALTTWRLPAFHASEGVGVPYPVLTPGPLVRAALAAVGSADVCHAHGALYHHTILARRTARRLAVPLILTEHVGWVPYPAVTLRAVQGAAWSLVGDATLAQAAAVVALNERVQGWLAARVAGCQPELISNGVDLARFSPCDERGQASARAAFGLPLRGVLGLMVGRDAPKKNRGPLLATPRHGWTLVLAGAPRAVTGPGVIDLGALAADQMPSLYRACDFLVHVAEGEGFPLAVQEAMATGLPVAILWDLGYSTTLAREIVDGRSDVPATVRAADELAADTSRRIAAGAKALAWARDHWTWEATVSAYETIYTRLAKRSR